MLWKVKPNSLILQAISQLELDVVKSQLKHCGKDGRVVGQPPSLVAKYSDRNLVNVLLRNIVEGEGGGTFCVSVAKSGIHPHWFGENFTRSLFYNNIPCSFGPRTPVVVRSRWTAPGDQLLNQELRDEVSSSNAEASQVKVCRDLESFTEHVEKLGKKNVFIQEYLRGPEVAVTVMPPTPDNPFHWPLPFVIRTDHEDGKAPDGDSATVTSTSRLVFPKEWDRDPAFARLARVCEIAARALAVTGPILVGARKATLKRGEPFDIFNIQPDLVSRLSKVPCRRHFAETLVTQYLPDLDGTRVELNRQTTLVMLAAKGLGWSPMDLLKYFIGTAKSPHEIGAASEFVGAAEDLIHQRDLKGSREYSMSDRPTQTRWQRKTRLHKSPFWM
jgi:hypothetical protein